MHNHYLQVLAEKGALGLTAFLSIWAAALLTTINLLKKTAQPEDRLLVWSVFCAALALGIHSFIDFNLSICILRRLRAMIPVIGEPPLWEN